MPRIALTSTTSFAPLTAHVAGMTVYNTATAGTGATAVVPGYYYNDGAQWVQTLNQATALKLEPWYNVATTSPATTNTQNIYQLGNVGIGTTAPTKKLSINSGNVNGAIQIVDGTQQDGRVLTSDANGVGTWKSVTVSSVTGVTPAASTPFGTAATGGDKYMNSYIDLPQGKWFVYMGFLVNGATAANTKYAGRLTFSTSTTSGTETTGFDFINGNRYIFTQTSNGSAGATTYGLFCSGIVRVDVTSTTTKRLYVWDANSRNFGTTTGVSLGAYGENYLFAIRAD
ncbi:hypothetical protein [Flavobacterium sp.]|uniref:hypothetical protein n=1 Tax=Flavobacterium sp. TaxID=239 RepID=UPI003D0D3D7E